MCLASSSFSRGHFTSSSLSASCGPSPCSLHHFTSALSWALVLHPTSCPLSLYLGLRRVHLLSKDKDAGRVQALLHQSVPSEKLVGWKFRVGRTCHTWPIGYLSWIISIGKSEGPGILIRRVIVRLSKRPSCAMALLIFYARLTNWLPSEGPPSLCRIRSVIEPPNDGPSVPSQAIRLPGMACTCRCSPPLPSG